MTDILQFPFMQRAILAGVVLAALLALLGIFVILRRMSFFGDGIAHASLAGIAIAILASANPLLIALLTSTVLALAIYYLEKKTNLSSDSVIGIFFTASMSLGVILMSFKSGYQPELISFLFGNILAIRSIDLVIIVALASLVMVFLLTNFRKLAMLTFDHESAYISGVKVRRLEILLYVVLAVSVVLGVKILGIVLVSALLIIPPSAAKIISASFKNLVAYSIIFSEITVLAGIIISYYANFPTGATIVLAGTVLFAITLFLGKALHLKNS